MKTFHILATLLLVAQNLWSQTSVSTESALRTAVESSKSVTLGADITLGAGRLVIDGQAVALNLNGHTLSRSLQAADSGGQVIIVQNGGSLTIDDKSDNSGRITGGWAPQGGGIYVSAGCSLTLKGGTVTGNRADQNAEGGYGGGIYTEGTLTLTGGIITGNTAALAGSGIYQKNCTLNMQGNPVVKNNTHDDLYMTSYQLVTLTGPFSKGADIGVSTEIQQTEFTSAYTTHNSAAPSTYFFVSSRYASGSVELNDKQEACITLSGYKYIDHTWNYSTKELISEEKTKYAGEYTLLSSHSGWTLLSNGGWFVADGNVSVGALKVDGTSNLILCNGATITVTEGVKVESGAVLNIYGQGGDTGRLIATNSHSGAAGIGSGGSKADGDAGLINIHGGTISATGNTYGAGIGGGDGHSFGLMAYNSGLNVYGGNVTAQGGKYAAGIGSGDEPDSYNHAGYVVIYGGTVHATGGEEGAGIGGGNEGKGAMFSILGGNVTAVGGRLAAGIGGGDEGHSATTSFYGGTVTAIGGYRGAGIGGGEDGYATAIEIRGGRIIAQGGPEGAGIGGGYDGDCNGVYIYDGFVQATGMGTDDGWGAGIGTGYKGGRCFINISGGTVRATSGKAAAIGNGSGKSDAYTNEQTDITISGGDVAVHSTANGAGIGTGEGVILNGQIDISGGHVIAASVSGAGIGLGSSYDDHYANMYGSILIRGGEVIASSEGGAGIGAGVSSEIKEQGLIQISGGIVTATSKEGGAIGAGKGILRKTSEGWAYLSSICNGRISITGNNTTLLLTPGSYLRDGQMIDCPPVYFKANTGGTLTMEGELAVSVNGTMIARDNRTGTLLNTHAEVRVDPCTHLSNTYTINTDNTHTAYCTYCGHTATESHQTNVSTCACGYKTGVDTYLVKLMTSDSNNYNYTTTQEVVKGNRYVLPDCMEVPQAWEFVGWIAANSSGNTIEHQTGETLLLPGHTITDGGTFLARYKKLELSLADNGTGNIATLEKYNQILTTSVTLAGRTLWKNGSWNTLCLPFDLATLTGTPLQEATVKTLSSTTFADGTLTMTFSDNLTSMEAGKPYLVKWDAQTPDHVESPMWNDVIISNNYVNMETEEVTFSGFFAPYTFLGKDKSVLCLGDGNTLGYPQKQATIGACRAFFRLSEEMKAKIEQSLLKKVVLRLSEEEMVFLYDNDMATAITTPLSSRSENEDEAWFALDGRQLDNQPTAKGIYIYNGKKVIIK